MNRGALGPDPPQLGPIIGIAVDEHAGPWIVLRLASWRSRCVVFAFASTAVVDTARTGRPAGSLAPSEYDRHQVGAVGRAGGQSRFGIGQTWSVEFPTAPAYASCRPTPRSLDGPDVAP